MIASLTGSVTTRTERAVVLDVHGVGLQAFCTPATIEHAVAGTTMTLQTFLYVREDALELYGFLTVAELRLFEKLLTVSGVGPRLAMAILSAVNVGDLENAINRGDATMLTHVSGVGTKTAQRIIIDLHGKLDVQTGDDDATSAVIEALTRLGYSAKEARDAASKTTQDATLEARLKEALRRLGR